MNDIRQQQQPGFFLLCFFCGNRFCIAESKSHICVYKKRKEKSRHENADKPVEKINNIYPKNPLLILE